MEALQAVASTSNCRTALDVLIGARERGISRKSLKMQEGNVGDVFLECQNWRGADPSYYRLKDGSLEDVYAVLLKAFANAGPKPSLRLPEIMDQVRSVTFTDFPETSSVLSALKEMDKLAATMPEGDRVIEWDNDKQVLSFPDPYFLYYLRWRHW